MVNKYFSLKNQSGEIVCAKVKLAESFQDRLMGLMFTKDMNIEEGLLINPCRSIHTFFMLMSIDVLFMDKNFKVIDVIYNLKPWRVSKLYFRANQVLEMKAGSMKKGISIGEVLREYV